MTSATAMEERSVEQTYSVRDLEQRYRVTTATVLHWIESRQLRAINVGVDPGKRKPRWRVSQAALDAFERQRSTRT